MIEHELLMVVAAPLIAFSRPSGALSWSLPSCWRPYAGALTGATPVIAVWMTMSNPWVATALQGALLWLWHTPLLYERALANETVHRVQHLSFFLAAMLFWWSLFYSRTYPRRTREIIALACLFLTVLHSGLLGALLTLSARIWFITQGQLSGEFNLTPLEDQQLAGVVMWIPMGIVYTTAALHFARRWLLPTGRREAEISLA
jgi:cytochrome c oxidase assembly factor CtaG